MTNASKPSRFIVDLSVEQRARLEEHRARLGLKSMAAVIRHWIDAGPSKLSITQKEISDAFPGRDHISMGELLDHFAPHAVAESAPVRGMAVSLPRGYGGGGGGGGSDLRTSHPQTATGEANTASKMVTFKTGFAEPMDFEALNPVLHDLPIQLRPRGLQVGPVSPKPGSRLKKAKK